MQSIPNPFDHKENIGNDDKMELNILTLDSGRLGIKWNPDINTYCLLR